MFGRIGATISGVELRLLNQLRDANAAAAQGAYRLATGRTINRPADNPSGFVNLSALENHKHRVTAALANVTQASGMVSQAQLVLDQIRSQLEIIRTKTVADEDQGLTPDQRAANQAAIDAAIDQIGALTATTIHGRRLLNGSAAYLVAGANGNQVRDVLAVSLGPNTSKTLSGSVTAAATQATLTHNTVLGLITSAATFILEGSRGTASISVTIGETLSTVANRVNQESHLTGVTASVVGGNKLVFASIGYGTIEEISITVTSGSFTSGADSGSDATATINGRNLNGEGNRFTVADNGFLAVVEFVGGFTGSFSDITISGDALTFALSTDPGRRSTLSIPSVQPVYLGGLSGTLDQLKSGGALSGLGANAVMAVRVVDEALGRLTRVDGLVDGFADSAIESSANLLDAAGDTLDDTIDQVADVDEEAEELLISKNQALAANALSGLSLFNQQRNSILELIRQIAGLD